MCLFAPALLDHIYPMQAPAGPSRSELRRKVNTGNLCEFLTWSRVCSLLDSGIEREAGGGCSVKSCAIFKWKKMSKGNRKISGFQCLSLNLIMEISNIGNYFPHSSCMSNLPGSLIKPKAASPIPITTNSVRFLLIVNFLFQILPSCGSCLEGLMRH